MTAPVPQAFVHQTEQVCPHHKLLDLIGSWDNPNASTIQVGRCAQLVCLPRRCADAAPHAAALMTAYHA